MVVELLIAQITQSPCSSILLYSPAVCDNKLTAGQLFSLILSLCVCVCVFRLLESSWASPIFFSFLSPFLMRHRVVPLEEHKNISAPLPSSILSINRFFLLLLSIRKGRTFPVLSLCALVLYQFSSVQLRLFLSSSWAPRALKKHQRRGHYNNCGTHK